MHQNLQGDLDVCNIFMNRRARPPVRDQECLSIEYKARWKSKIPSLRHMSHISNPIPFSHRGYSASQSSIRCNICLTPFVSKPFYVAGEMVVHIHACLTKRRHVHFQCCYLCPFHVVLCCGDRELGGCLVEDFGYVG